MEGSLGDLVDVVGVEVAELLEKGSLLSCCEFVVECLMMNVSLAERFDLFRD